MSDKRVIVVGGGTAGLGAAYTLKQRGIEPLVLEADDHPGGRLGGHLVDGFIVDGGADFFCATHDVALRMCKELNVPLIRSLMDMVIYWKGRYIMWPGDQSPRSRLKHLSAIAKLGLLSPSRLVPLLKVARDLRRQYSHLSFASDSRVPEIATDETFGGYLDRLGASESLRTLLYGFLANTTLGHVADANREYILTYIAQALVQSDQLYVPEEGASALARALADACGDAIRVSTPVQRVNIENGVATGVVVDGETIEADAVITAVQAVKVSGIIPDLPSSIRQTLDDVPYSAGCRVVIGLDERPLPEGWNVVLYPEDDTPLVLDRSLNLPKCVPEGKSTMDLISGRDRAKELMHLDDDAIKHELLKAVRAKAPPGANLPADDGGIFTQVYRWEQAICMVAPGMFDAVDGMKSVLNQHVSNLFLAGDYMAVPCVNGALTSGVRAAEQVADLLASQT